MATNFTICSINDVHRISSRGGNSGLKYPWLDRSITVGNGFFIERTIEELDKDKGRPSVPTKLLAKYGMAYKTYKAQRGLTYGYYCERVK